ncbi:MAG TPA: FxsA family protein [Thermoleophilaceae bacterium]
MPLWLLLLLFIVVPLAELYVILQVAELLGGGVTGALLTVGLLALDSVLGTLLLRSQGRAVWRRFNVALSEARMPHREVIDGVLVIVGGALLLTPGFLSDILGVLLLVPPTRAGIRRLLIRRLGSRLTVGPVPGGPAQPRRDFDVEGTASEYRPPPQGRLER